MFIPEVQILRFRLSDAISCVCVCVSMTWRYMQLRAKHNRTFQVVFEFTQCHCHWIRSYRYLQVHSSPFLALPEVSHRMKCRVSVWAISGDPCPRMPRTHPHRWFPVEGEGNSRGKNLSSTTWRNLSGFQKKKRFRKAVKFAGTVNIPKILPGEKPVQFGLSSVHGQSVDTLQTSRVFHS